jgi:hypothetical protein
MIDLVVSDGHSPPTLGGGIRPDFAS